MTKDKVMQKMQSVRSRHCHYNTTTLTATTTAVNDLSSLEMLPDTSINVFTMEQIFIKFIKNYNHNLFCYATQ